MSEIHVRSGELEKAREIQQKIARKFYFDKSIAETALGLVKALNRRIESATAEDVSDATEYGRSFGPGLPGQ
jgi:hypothetical protein